jgi:hypothetical protein
MMDDICQIAQDILNRNPDPVVECLLKRDILKQTDLDSRALNEHPHIQQLVREQRPDGGWGRFHSQDTKSNQKIPTTEFAVERALSLGLDVNHPILQRAVDYLERLLNGDLPFPDLPEKNDRWSLGTRLFTAATLARISSHHPLLESERELWVEIAERIFHAGCYDPDAEVAAHADLTGASVRGSYLTLRAKYQVALIGSIPGMLSPGVENAYAQWLWSLPEGLGYLSEPLNQPPKPKSAHHVDRWLASLSLFLQSFPAQTSLAKPAFDWLQSQRGPDGFWDFGSRPINSPYLPLSTDWRKSLSRKFDWTVRSIQIIAS